MKWKMCKNRISSYFRTFNKKKVIYTVLFFCGLAVAVIIAIPIFLGCFSIIFDKGEIPSPLASIQLAILATALGAVVLWFAGHQPLSTARDTDKDTSEDKSTERLRRRGVVTVGTFLLFAAMCFALFGLLSPVLPSAIAGQEFLDAAIKWIAFLGIAAGSISLGLSLCIGIFGIWVWTG